MLSNCVLIRKLTPFVIEAEVVGILGVGSAETFQVTKEIRSEMNALSVTIVDLYVRQIAVSEQVCSILHYVKFQKAMVFVNALIECISVAGNVALHVLSGGMAVLEKGEDGLEVGELVESLLGTGKEWSSIITQPMVKRFIKAGDVVLKEKTWNDLPEANRRAVEAAANGLGLSNDDLRSRFRGAAEEEHSTPG